MKRKNKQTPGKKRILQGTAGFVAASLVVIGIYTTMQPKKPSLIEVPHKEVHTTGFEDARRDARQRQSFLNALVNKDEIPYCSSIVYDHDGTKIIDYYKKQMARVSAPDQKDYISIGGTLESFKEGNYDMKVASVLELTEQEENSPIFLGRRPFEGKEFAYMNSKDLRAAIITHEGAHLMQHAKGVSFLNKIRISEGVNKGRIRHQVLYAAYEYDAHMQELPRLLSSEFNVSPNHLNIVKVKFITTGLLLKWSASKGSTLEQQLVQEVITKSSSIPLLQNISIPSEFYNQPLRP